MDRMDGLLQWSETFARSKASETEGEKCRHSSRGSLGVWNSGGGAVAGASRTLRMGRGKGASTLGSKVGSS